MAKRDSAARRYAEAAFQVAERDGTVDVWRRELGAAATIVGQAAIGRTLSNPAIPIETRATAVGATFGRVASQPVTNLIQLMLRRGRIEDVPRVASEFRRLDNAQKGITIATATAAAPLSDDEVAALTTRLEALTGGRIELDVNVDPSLLGGLVVQVGDRLIDGSVRGRLERLRNQLVSGAL
jgi:F-type H+-transporting ATPase subunit delta